MLPASREHSSATMQNYDIIVFSPYRQGAISLHSADGTPLKILGYIQFALEFGNKYLPVEALVLPHLGSDAILLNSSIMKAFGANLYWAAERLLFKNGDMTIPATQMKRPIKSKYCSVIKQNSDAEKVPVFVSRKYIVPAAHEALIRVFSTA